MKSWRTSCLPVIWWPGPQARAGVVLADRASLQIPLSSADQQRWKSSPLESPRPCATISRKSAVWGSPLMRSPDRLWAQPHLCSMKVWPNGKLETQINPSPSGFDKPREETTKNKVSWRCRSSTRNSNLLPSFELIRWAEDSGRQEGSRGQHTHCVYGKYPADVHLSLFKGN